jgi:trehalose-phosphatase
MTEMPERLIARMISAFRRGYRLALLFDYDGTLTPFVEHPALARLEPPTLRLLREFVFRPGVSVGIISGRSLEDLRELMDIPGLYYAGTSGLEFDFQGERHTVAAAEAFRETISDAAQKLSRLVRGFPGAFVERKDLGITLHYRRVSNQISAPLLMEADCLLRDYQGQLTMIEGPLAWEIAPKVDWDKGAALRFIIDAIGRPVLPVYAGASANDSNAFAAVSSLGGIALGVGASAPSVVRFRLETPADLINLLDRLNAAFDAHRPDPRSFTPIGAVSLSSTPQD